MATGCGKRIDCDFDWGEMATECTFFTTVLPVGNDWLHAYVVHKPADDIRPLGCLSQRDGRRRRVAIGNRSCRLSVGDLPDGRLLYHCLLPAAPVLALPMFPPDWHYVLADWQGYSPLCRRDGYFDSRFIRRCQLDGI